MHAALTQTLPAEPGAPPRQPAAALSAATVGLEPDVENNAATARAMRALALRNAMMAPPPVDPLKRAEVEALYAKHNPAKLAEVDTLLAKYGDEKLLRMVRAKYKAKG
eukprot:SAG22_NODE_355_length_11775_cov_76.400651_3_plen_108_part_00